MPEMGEGGTEMEAAPRDGWLARLSDWHAFTVELASRMREAGLLEMARRLETGADDALNRYIDGARVQPQQAAADSRTATSP